MTAGTYALVLPLCYAALQVLAFLRLPESWSLWTLIPSPVVSISAVAVVLGMAGTSSEDMAILSLSLPTGIILLALLSLSWNAHGEG